MFVAIHRRAALCVALFMLVLFALTHSADASVRERGGSIYRDRDGSPYAMRAGSAVLAEAERFLGRGNPTGFRGPWCKAFTNFILRRAGRHPSPSMLAMDALKDGRRVASPAPGDEVIINGGRHVGFVVEDRGATLRIISGNWSGKVKIASIRRYQVVAFVRT